MPDAERPQSRDLGAFLAFLRKLAQETGSQLGGFFESGLPMIVSRAPGRLDVMGGIADYSGSLVLQWPIAEATYAAVQRTADDIVTLVSLSADRSMTPRRFSLSTQKLAELSDTDYAVARAWFRKSETTAWTAYVLGVLVAMTRERGMRIEGGLRILMWSQVPEAKGVSSSAALEVAAMSALAGVFEVSIPGDQLARLCQITENQVVGAPCGIMDQMTSALGRDSHLLALLCQPAKVEGFVSMPPAIRFWGIDSGIRHAVSGSDYTSVRTGAFMGYRILAELAGLSVSSPDADGVVRVDDPRWHGYLANVGPTDWQQQFAGRVPVEMRGADFLDRYGGITDPVTRVDRSCCYAVRQPAAHPIHEHQHVRRFAELLASDLDDASLNEMGELMYASHESYSACGLGSDGTDLLMQLVREQGRGAGLYGAKITGGGSGGTVAILGRSDAEPAVKSIAAEYERRTGRHTTLFSGSSPGACAFGLVRLDAGGQLQE